MHAVWDTGLVTLAAAGTSDFAGDLIQRFNAQKAQFQAQLDPVLIVGESFGLAKTAVYAKATPAIPTINQFVNVIPSKCAIQAPAAINAVTINAQQSFQNPATLDVIRQQLYKGGVRLAAILNRL
jgi:hypothetical protein